ncbi:hypothetical protein [Pantoea sp. Acro-807]|uniref:hypothetical protein n=1 Tax=Pantoea sp. Acro-807 TaxID=2608356 RepID=UPI00141A2B1B|nr:hypothetical protein [Pantoea sp. Acro-807]NIE72600.1 hypothetical protein [Pantoea sp. Acro-807]
MEQNISLKKERAGSTQGSLAVMAAKISGLRGKSRAELQEARLPAVNLLYQTVNRLLQVVICAADLSQRALSPPPG